MVALGVGPEPGSDAITPGWIASGFFYGRRVGTDADGIPQYYVYLVSNRHVFDGLDSIIVRANPPADNPDPARDYPVALNDDTGQPLWLAHPRESVDVAVIKVDYNRLQSEGMQLSFFTDDELSMTGEQMKAAGTTEGDYVYVLGYPMGLVGEQRAVVIVRNGSIARIRDALAGTEDSYLVDSSVFPGNSGGPVVIRPKAMALHGTTAPQKARLIGIVTGYVSYSEVAVSAQTGRVRMLFEENSGLASAHLVDSINECIDPDPRFHQTRMQFAAPPPEGGPQEAT